ncbi:hypothetical protein AB0M97_10250 [Streptomyces sp. NPDC051207]|uniref:hypothetical protein n=1 Tax=Streptomyces sp. NPDC051207 TaxID=3154641 RepID=UPI0034159E4E
MPLLEADPDADIPWLATAYVPGLTLAEHTAAHGPLARITAATTSPLARSAVTESQTPTAAASSAPTQTQVITLSPWSPGGTPATGITITDRASGSCFRTAESTMRTEAWRCTAGNQILDPCFSPDSNPSDTSALCLDGAPDRMVEPSVPECFPGNNNHMPGRTRHRTDNPRPDQRRPLLVRRWRHRNACGTTPELRLRQRRLPVRLSEQDRRRVDHLVRRSRQRSQRLHADHDCLRVAR